MKTLAAISLLFCASLCWSQSVNIFTGNVDVIDRSTFQVVNPNPYASPINVYRVGLERHTMNEETGDFQIQGQWDFFSLYDDGSDDSGRNITNCVKWFDWAKKHELALNLNHLPGFWDGSKSPWPYFQVTVGYGAQLVEFTDLDKNQVFINRAQDVQCTGVLDNRPPYFPNYQ